MRYGRIGPVLMLVVAGLSVGHAPLADSGPTLQIGDTRYLGLVEIGGEVESFRGIPFAAPPVGEGRWRSPAPPDISPGDRDARQFAPICLQGGSIADWYRGVVSGFDGDPAVVSDPPESEDCLYLNLWRPMHRGAKPLPILVYIHGGSNSGGWSWEPNYHGAGLARRGMVVVSIAYRLGVFGFFSHPEQPQSNFGLLDQLAALNWIRTNAGELGGDPQRITVMGESSGGNDIIVLLASPRGHGLFQRAIVQSAGSVLHETPEARDEQSLALDLQARLLGHGGSLAALRQVPGERVFELAREVYAGHDFDPVVDGDSLVEPAIDAVNRSNLSPVDLLIGSNRDEWKMYLEPDADLSDWSSQGLPEEARGPVTKLLATEADGRRALDRAVTARYMVCPSLFLANAVHRAGGRSWVYWFTRVRPGKQAAAMGAYHGAVLPYVFDTHDDWLPTEEADRVLTQLMMGYWSRFAAHGDPNGDGDPAWPEYTGPGSDVLQLDSSIASTTHPEQPLCGALGPGGSPASTP